MPWYRTCGVLGTSIAHLSKREGITGMSEKLDEKVSDLENDMASLQADHKRVMSDLYGNGQPGLKGTLIAFIAEYRTGETLKAATVVLQNSKVMRWVAILGLIVAILAGLQGYH